MREARGPKVSIVIRCRNEEDWIGHCLTAVFSQEFLAPEVVIVDNGSTDQTLAIVSTFPIGDVVTVSEYSPGAALNRGVEATSGDGVVLLSAHCVPRDAQWLGYLVGAFEDGIAGVYGRQLPVAFSEAADFRDLTVTFGPEPRVQTSDCFFHNANSAILRATWECAPFDEGVPNIEDRLWAKHVLGQGFKIAYEPRAAVFHYHGIHHNQSRKRAESTLEVLKKVESYDRVEYLPESLLPSVRDIVAIIPILQGPGIIAGCDPLTELLRELKACAYIEDTFVVSNDDAVVAVASRVGVSSLRRPPELESGDAGLGDGLKWAVEKLAAEKRFPDYVVYANPEYILRPAQLIDKLIEDACFKGLDTVLVAYPEYQNYWTYSPDSDEYEKVGEDLIPRQAKHPVYRSVPGLGTVTRARIARQGRLVSDRRVGLVATTDLRHTLRTSDDIQRQMIGLILANSSTQLASGGDGR